MYVQPLESCDAIVGSYILNIFKFFKYIKPSKIQNLDKHGNKKLQFF
jgi:phosphatidylglycerophosphatase A